MSPAGLCPPRGEMTGWTPEPRVKVKSELEASVHSIRSYIEEYGHIEELCCFNIDIKMVLMNVIERYFSTVFMESFQI